MDTLLPEIDDTYAYGGAKPYEQRWGKRIAARSIHRDPVRFSDSHFRQSYRTVVGMSDDAGENSLDKSGIGIAIFKRAVSV